MRGSEEGEHLVATVTQPPLPPAPSPYRLRVEQYDAMVAAGILTKRDRIELIEGLLVARMPKGPKHSAVTGQLGEQLRLVLPAGWHIRLEQPVRIPDYDEPEPDLSVARGAFLDSENRHPGPRDIALLVEVVQSTLSEDRLVMGRVYARAGIPVFWVVNLRGRSRLVEVYTHPTRTRGYTTRVDYRPGLAVPVIIEKKEVGRIFVADVLH
jgi:Uma2 family endonuclease